MPILPTLEEIGSCLTMNRGITWPPVIRAFPRHLAIQHQHQHQLFKSSRMNPARQPSPTGNIDPGSVSSFEIDTETLQQQSGKPHHLQERMTTRRTAQLTHQTVEANREQIMSARKRRLSDRLHHVSRVVEQQRELRSAHRDEKSSQISKNQEQAEKKRKQRIQSRREQSSKQVEKAKAVARHHQERSQAINSRRRMELEERLRVSEVRRQIASRIPRSRLLEGGAVETEMVRVNIAARRIQRSWRRYRVEPLLAQWRLTGLLEPLHQANGQQNLKPMPFNDLLSKIQDAKVIQLTGKILAHAKRSSSETRALRLKNPSKVFLSAFVIVYHTDEIMPEIKEEEEKIKALATRMIQNFDNWVNNGEMYLSTFVEAWQDYHTRFEDWKSKDTEKLLEAMSEHFMQLERLQESVRGQVDFESQWKPKIEKQQHQIKSKVLRIGGQEALDRLLLGQKEFREQNADSNDAEIMAESMNRSTKQSVLDSPYQQEGQKVETNQPGQMSPPEMNSALAEFGHMVSNEKLAHELILNPDFELKRKTDTFEAQVMMIAKKAFFDKIREDAAANKMSWLPNVVRDIRQQFQDMLGQSSRSMAPINEVLDADLIKQQINNNACNIPKVLQFVIHKMLELCAPIRDQEIRSVLEELDGDLVAVLEKIFALLETMQLDLANYRLRSIRPVLMEQAAEYERGKFEQALKENRAGLNRTEMWLATACAAARDIAAARNPENIAIPENRVRYDTIYSDAMLSMIFGTEIVSPDRCPETLMLDQERLVEYQNEAQAITVVAALVMLTRNMIPELRDDQKALMILKDELFVLLKDGKTTMNNLTVHLVTSIGKALARFKKSVTEEQKSLVETMVSKTLSYKDTVYLLLNRRIQGAIRHHLSTGKFRRDTKTGLDVVQAELEAFSGKIFVLSKYNRDVYAPWYDQIMNKAMA